VADATFKSDDRSLQIRFSIEQSGTAVNETTADVEERKKRDLTRGIGALRLLLFSLERRHEFVPPGADRLFGLLHPDGCRSHVGHNLQSHSCILPTGSFDFRLGATDSSLIPRENRDVEIDTGPDLETFIFIIRIKNGDQGHDARALPVRPLGRSFNTNLGGAHVWPRSQRVFEALRFGTARREVAK
jgi:hypothetical protein